jgi:hypothetical protein
MSQALGELRGPVAHEALRLRMAAMHGREDALLEPGRFARLLRQANDAEVADVRKVGDDDYEVSAHRSAGVPAIAAPAGTAAAPVAPPAAGGSAVEPAGVAADAPPDNTGSRDNGQRFGVRFRRGSRAPLRPGEIPLIGVVQMEPPPVPEPVAVAAETEALAPETPAKRPARPRAPRKKAAAAAASAPAPGIGAAEAAPPKPRRSRSRAKKKAE